MSARDRAQNLKALYETLQDAIMDFQIGMAQEDLPLWRTLGETERAVCREWCDAETAADAEEDAKVAA